ncbi:MAG: hypothetical protein ACI9NY_001831, partial [Kiritimatiellia bacterium]
PHPQQLQSTRQRKRQDIVNEVDNDFDEVG